MSADKDGDEFQAMDAQAREQVRAMDDELSKLSESRRRIESQIATQSNATEPVDVMGYQLVNLAHCCDQFYSGKLWTAHMLISVILRTLLVGSSGDDALAPQVITGLHLLPLAVTPKGHPEHFALPAEVTFQGDYSPMHAGLRVKILRTPGRSTVATSAFGEMFDNSRPPIPLADWLKQRFLRPAWTLEDFIKAMAHGAGGAHIRARKPKQRAIVEAMEAWGSCHWHITPGIGRSVHPQLVAQRAAAHPGHQTYVP